MPLRPGWSKTDYFNRAWQDSISPTLEKFLTGATIQVFLPGTSKSTFDPATGTYEYIDSEEIIYEGPARVQPRRAAQEKFNNASDTSVQTVQFQIPLPEEVVGVEIVQVPTLSEAGDVVMVPTQREVRSRVPVALRPKHRVRVTESKDNPELTKYEYVIFEVVDSSNPIEQTFWAKVDQEVQRG